MTPRQVVAFTAPCYRAWETFDPQFRKVNQTSAHSALSSIVTVNR